MAEPSKEPALLLFPGPCQYLGRHGRHHRQGNEQAGQQGVGDGQSHVHEQLSGDSFREHDGQEHADRGQGGSHNGPGHLPGTFYGCFLHGVSLTPQPVDILNYHNGIVHQHTDPQGQSGQGDDIQCHAAEIHAYNGCHQADGNGEGHHDGRTQILQKQNQDQDGQQSPEQDITDDGIHHQVDVDSLVHQGNQGKILILLHHFSKTLCQQVRYFPGGISCLLLYGQHDTCTAIHIGVDLGRIVCVKHICHIPQGNHRYIVHMQVHQGHGLQFFYRGGFVTHPYHIIYAFLRDITCRHGEILGHQQVLHRVYCEDVVHVCLLVGVFLRLRKLFLSLGKLFFRILQLLFGLFHLVQAALDLLCPGIQLGLGHL